MLGQTFGRASTEIDPPREVVKYLSLEILQKRKDKHLSGMSEQWIDPTLRQRNGMTDEF